MQITLTQSGGIAGKKLTTSLNTTLTYKEWELLLGTIKIDTTEKSRKRDTLSYTLQKKDDKGSITSIDIGAIPDAHTDLFKKLFDGLKPAE